MTFRPRSCASACRCTSAGWCMAWWRSTSSTSPRPRPGWPRSPPAIARIEWVPNARFTLIAGRDAPVNAPGGKLVGARFLSGNIYLVRALAGEALGRIGDSSSVHRWAWRASTPRERQRARALGRSHVRGPGVLAGGEGPGGYLRLATSQLLGFGTPAERRTFSGGVSACASPSSPGSGRRPCAAGAAPR